MALRFDTPYEIGEAEEPPCPSQDCECPDCRWQAEQDNYSGPWEVASGDTSREQYEQAWEQKRRLR